MIKLDAIKSEKIWGYELWLASTHSNGCQKNFKDFLGGNYPLLVKVIQANDILSIQVHPDDDFAVQLEGPGNRGKTECWYVLEAQKDAKVVYGIKNGFSKSELAKAIGENTLEDYLEVVPVRKGDFIFIPAGTVHAIGGGLRLLETQQSCDLTYRLYDWGRGRELQIEKGLSVIKKDGMIPVQPFPNYFECDYFSLEKINVREKWHEKVSSGDKIKSTELIFVISSDSAKLSSEDGKTTFQLSNEDIFAIGPGEEIVVEGAATIMKILCK